MRKRETHNRNSKPHTLEDECANKASELCANSLENYYCDLEFALEQLQPHDHICLIFETSEEWQKAIVPFIRDGLHRREKILYFTDARSLHEIRKLLCSCSIDVEEAESNRQLQFLQSKDFSSSNGAFDPEVTVSSLVRETASAASEGFMSVRVTADISTFLSGQHEMERLLKFEERLDTDLLAEHPCIVLCQYNKRLIDPKIIKAAFLTHPLITSGNRVMRNLHCIPAREYLGENRVQQETECLMKYLEREHQTHKALSRVNEELEQVKGEMRKCEERFRLLTKKSADLAFIVDDKGRVTHESSSLTKLLGSYSESSAAISILQHIHKDDRDEFCTALSRAEQKPGATEKLEIRLNDRNGAYHYFEAVITNLTNESAISGFVVNARNITDEKSVSNALKRMETRDRFLFEQPNDAVFILDLELKHVAVNKRAGEMLGYTEEEIIGASVDEISAEPEKSNSVLHRLLAGERVKPYERYLRKKNGELVCVEVNVDLAKDESGNPLHIQSIARDITDRKAAENALRESEARFRRLAENAQDIIYRISLHPDTRLEYVSPAVARITGYTPEELYADPHYALKILCQDDHHRLEEMLNPEKSFYKPVTLKLARRDGDELWTEQRNVPVYDDEGNLIAIEGIARDITAYTKNQEELKRRHEEVQKVFSSTVTALAALSELRDPYTAGHQRRVALLAVAIAKEMGLDAKTVMGVRVAALLHDIGKLYVPSDILSKPGKLSDHEFAMIEQHSTIVRHILADIDFPWPVAEIAYQHHERLDGSGYPQGLKGDEMLLEAKILAVADVVEAMVSHRPYRPALDLQQALDEIKKYRNTKFDSDVVDTCVKLFEEGFDFEDQ